MNARQAALSALERCRRDGAWGSSALDGIIRSEGLDRREAALASALCFGVLQNRAYFDFLIDAFCTTRSEKLEKKVLDILRLGVCQLVLLDRIPPRAAVNETVELCRVSGLERASALVNAVLRRVAERRGELPEVQGRGTASYLAVRYSHPLWLAERFIREKGYGFTEELFSADNAFAPLDIQINSLHVTRTEYASALDRLEIPYTLPPYPSDCISLQGGAVEELPGYEDGLFYVQDRAARMAVDIAGLTEGMRVLDACACPGGKSFAAALNMRGNGRILSCDIHEKKLRTLRETASRLGLGIIRTECRDARVFFPDYENAFDAVIADVPCSGMGVIRKKPEIRGKREEELCALGAIQREILQNLSRYVLPGGTLLYCTCTILREENEEIVKGFLAEHPAFSPCDFTVGERCSVDGCYTFYPHLDGTDGFFVSKMKKVAE